MAGQLDLKHVGIFTRDDPADGDYRLDVIRRLFSRAHIEVTMLPGRAPDIPLDLVIAMGGDGTVLRALSTWPGVPVLAVNYGHLGFLTASDRNELDRVLVRLLSDDYFIEERLTLEVGHRGSAYRCVNEVVVKGTTHMIQVTLRVNGQEVSRPRGDGIIVGTPTGSTAYLLSTGAPLVMPNVDCINVKPLNEYSFSSRSIILPGSARIDVEVGTELRGGEVLLVCDGNHVVRVTPGDAIHVERSPVPARLVFFETDYFFRNLKSRLRW
ncbi:NAD(+)/NADH kinase [Myxococcota bacterium]|jgi:NAD+ kinase|nr:NAD(+)/NADH kinase [Myxococcota bacterium]